MEEIQIIRPALQQGYSRLVSDVTGIELSDGIVVLHGQQTGSCGFAYSRVATDQGSRRVDISPSVPPLSLLGLSLVASNVNILPTL